MENIPEKVRQLAKKIYAREPVYYKEHNGIIFYREKTDRNSIPSPTGHPYLIKWNGIEAICIDGLEIDL